MLKEAKAAAEKAEKDLAYAKANQKEAVIPKSEKDRSLLENQRLMQGLTLSGGLGTVFGAAALVSSWMRGTPHDYESITRAKLATQTSEAERKSITAGAKVREIEDAYKKVLEAVTKQGLEEERKKSEDAANRLKKETEQRDKRDLFEVDALSKAGLFAGSSLLMNPDFSIQQEQVRLLASIDNSIKNGGDFR